MAAVTISYDAGIALIQSSRMIVVDLAKAQVVKTCALGKGPKESIWVYSWLLNIPSRGAVLAESFADSKENRTTIMGTLTDPTMPCDKSRFVLDHGDLRYIAALGTTLIADIGGSDSAGLFTLLDADGIVKGSDSGVSYSYGYQVPPAELDGIGRPSNIWLGINNSEMMVIVLHDKSGDGRVLGFRKKDSTWHRAPVPTLRPLKSNAWVPLPVMRGFGHFLAMAEVLPKDARNPESAGRSEWRKEKGRSGPEMDFLYRNNAQLVFPGRLHIYDVDTDRIYTIRTDQGDSEILLVENNTVYYRASSRLYSAAITADGIGRPRLLATDEAIRDAHWAFIKH